MLFVRFLPIIGTLAIAGSLAGKKKIAKTAGTLSTTNAMFVFLLIFVVLLVGALSLSLIHILIQPSSAYIILKYGKGWFFQCTTPATREQRSSPDT